MSFTLIDLGSENFELSSNVWSWKPTLEIIKSLDILSDGKVRQMEYAATGVKIELEDAHDIGRKIQETILPKLEPNKRMFMDLSITDAPDDGTIYRDDDEKWKNYSASYEWLKEFSDFCLKSKGFQVF
ncbi:MAG TPA: hypothetical protein PKY82_00950 [Pyrinomonadaceae bacterium]|nr:hypothetical protein [Pyrinomonadaceae bacterium]